MVALGEVIDVPAVQGLMSDFHTLTGLVVALLDIDGHVLVSAGWQDVCTKFHRVHPETLAHCRESDTMLTQGVPRGEFRAYTCGNGLTDVVTPLFVGDMHVGNIFSGQFLYDDEEPDVTFFERQAERYGFDHDDYVNAAMSVPRFSRETINTFMRFYVGLTEQIAQSGYSNLVLSQRVSELRDAENGLRTTNERLERLLRSITGTMGKVVEARDPYTQGHETGVAKLSVLIAQEMGLSEDEIDTIEIGALVHDIGKLAVPAEILTKPGRLSAVEFDLIKAHPESGYEILKGIDFGRPVAEIALRHHERMDGSGYPGGLAGDDILIAARVVAVADVIEAMASHRPYRAALGLDVAMAEIVGHPEKFDSDVVAACERLYAAGKIEL